MGGFEMQLIARGYLAYDITRSPFILGLITAGSALPVLVFSLFGGAIADRMDRKWLIQMGQGAAALLALFVALSITTGTVTWYHLLAASILRGAIFSFTMPARQAIIPQLVGKEKVTNAMALTSAAFSVTMLVAPATAGVLYALMGPGAVYYIIAAVSFLGVLLTAMVPRVGGGPVRAQAPMVADIKAGLSYVWHSPLVLPLLAIGMATALLAMPFEFLLPVFVVEIYDRGPGALGLLVSIIGLGALIGALFIASMGNWRRGLLLIMSCFMTGVALLLVALIPVYYAAAAIVVLLGLGYAGNFTLVQALMMQEAEDKYRGRVTSLFMMNFGLVPLGLLPTGLMVQFLGGQQAIGVLAVLMLAFSSFILITQKRLRKIE